MKKSLETKKQQFRRGEGRLEVGISSGAAADGDSWWRNNSAGNHKSHASNCYFILKKTNKLTKKALQTKYFGANCILRYVERM